MHSTFMALCLLLTEPAMLKSCNGIVKQHTAFCTKRTPTVFLPAPQFYHMPYRFLLPFYSSHTHLLIITIQTGCLPSTPSVQPCLQGQGLSFRYGRYAAGGCGQPLSAHRPPAGRAKSCGTVQADYPAVLKFIHLPIGQNAPQMSQGHISDSSNSKPMSLPHEELMNSHCPREHRRHPGWCCHNMPKIPGRSARPGWQV